MCIRDRAKAFRGLLREMDDAAVTITDAAEQPLVFQRRDVAIIKPVIELDEDCLLYTSLHAHGHGVGVRVQPFAAGKAHHVLGHLLAMDTKSVVGKDLVEKRTGEECKEFCNGDHTTTLLRTANGKVIEDVYKRQYQIPKKPNMIKKAML